MPIITLPDGSQRQFDNPVSVLEVAQDIGAGLAKATIAGRVNGERHDACDIIEKDAAVEIITELSKPNLTAWKKLFPGQKRVIPLKNAASHTKWQF